MDDAVIEPRRLHRGYALPDLGEYLSSRFASDQSLLFSFLRPRTLFSDLMSFLCKCGDPDDTLKIVKFAITELPKDENVIYVLEKALSSILDVAYVDEKQSAAVSEMWRELDQATERLGIVVREHG
jgi:hypothetical protein